MISLAHFTSFFLEKGIVHFAEAIQSAQAPEGLTLDFSKNSVTEKGMEILANAIKSGNAPDKLTTGLVWNNIGTQGIKSLNQCS